MSGVYFKESFCDFCGKEYKTINGKNSHQAFCKLNPNKKVAWNKGLTKETSECVAYYSNNMQQTKNSIEWKENNQVWNKGLTKETSESVFKYSESCKQTKNSLEWKEEHRKRIYEKYDGKHWTQTEEYRKTRRKNNFEKYGVENLWHVPEIYDKILKSRYKFYEYILPSGKVINLQGYEKFALDYLIKKMNICENDIIFSINEVPEIYWYDEKLNKHRYYPDLYIKSKKLIIEVKSTYTIMCDKEMNIQKQLATKNEGLLHQVWLISEKGNLISIIEELKEYYENNQ